MRTPAGRRRRMAISFSFDRSEILMPSTFAALAEIAASAVSIAALWSREPQ